MVTLLQRMSLTSASRSARPQAWSVLSAGTPSRAASVRHARSASESPCAIVSGRIFPISMQSASVIGSMRRSMSANSVFSSRSATCWGSSPFGSRFPSSLDDQRVGHAATRSEVGEHTPRTFSRRSTPLDHEPSRGLDFEGVYLCCHAEILARRVSADQQSFKTYRGASVPLASNRRPHHAA